MTDKWHIVIRAEPEYAGTETFEVAFDGHLPDVVLGVLFKGGCQLLLRGYRCILHTTIVDFAERRMILQAAIFSKVE